MPLLPFPYDPPVPTADVITDHVTRAQNRLAAQFQKPNLLALVQAHVQGFQDLENAAQSILTGRPASLAAGDALSHWGASVGEPRPLSGTGATYDSLTLTLSEALVAGNIISGTVTVTTYPGGVPTTSTTTVGQNFATDSPTTMAAIAAAIGQVSGIASATASGLAITVVPRPGYQVALTGFVTTGGVSQATWAAVDTIDDSAYAGLVKAQIAANTSEGTPENVLAFLRDLGASSAVWMEPGDYRVHIAIGGTLSLPDAQVLTALIRATPPVALDATVNSTATPFGFSGAPGTYGFDSGQLGRTLL